MRRSDKIGFLIFSHHVIILRSTHADKQLRLCSLFFLNLHIQGDNLAVILVCLNNRYSLLTRISHLSSTDSIRPFYSIAPGASRTSLPLLCSSTQPSSSSHPSCYAHKTIGDMCFFSLTVTSPCCKALICTFKICSNSLTQTERQTYNWHTQHV